LAVNHQSTYYFYAYTDNSVVHFIIIIIKIIIILGRFLTRRNIAKLYKGARALDENLS